MDGTRAEELVERYADAILRIGYTWLGDMDDAKDICQTVLIKLVEEGRRFPDLGQERAWVVRLSVNACKNWKKSAWFRRRAPLEEGLHLAAEVPEPEDGALLALEARRPAPRRQIPLRRVAALAACAGLVLGLVNYQAVAAGTERVIRYFLGVGAAEENLSLLVQGEALHKEDGAFLYRIGGAYQRDGMLTVPVSVFTREGALAEGEELRYRLLVYDADGKKLRRVSSYYDDAKGEMSAPVFLTEGTTYHPSRLDVLADWMSRTYWAQGYTEGETEINHMEVPDGAKGPYTFDVEVYSNDVSHLGYQPMWEGGVLALDTPQTLDAVSVSRTFQEGTVTALVGDDGHSVAFYGELSPALAAREEKLQQLWVPMLYSEDEAGRVQPVPAIWFIDEAGNRYRGCSIWHMPAAWVTDEAGNRYERYRVFPGPAEEYWPEFRLLEEPEGKITAIEVEALVFNILRTDRPREVETRSYTSTYNPLNWVIELP